VLPTLRLITEPTPDLASAREFADAMSTLASGIVLVTCQVEGRPWGMTVTAFAPVSAEPPTILVSLESKATAAHAISATQRFGVSILERDQIEVARRGSTPGKPKFLELFTAAGDGCTSPVVRGALAHFDCELSDAVEVADHTVFFGRVRAAEASRGGRPLLYYRRGYRALADVAIHRKPDERSPTCLAN